MEPDSVTRVFRGKLITVEVQSWPAGDREVVRHPGACAVVGLTAAGEVLLVRQMREAVGEILLEIPAGIFDQPGEDAARCAARELLEETGHRAEEVEPLGSIYTSPGFTDERIELFVARAIHDREPEDGIELAPLGFEQALAAVREGRIKDAKTITGLMLARDTGRMC
ncbi:MAG: NUDIX hydrolase [Actinomycetota bacterium]